MLMLGLLMSKVLLMLTLNVNSIDVESLVVDASSVGC